MGVAPEAKDAKEPPAKKGVEMKLILPLAEAHAEGQPVKIQKDGKGKGKDEKKEKKEEKEEKKDMKTEDKKSADGTVATVDLEKEEKKDEGDEKKKKEEKEEKEEKKKSDVDKKADDIIAKMEKKEQEE